MALFTGRKRFNIEETSLSFVLEKDGTEVDDEYLFSFALKPDTVVMVLKDGESWSSVQVPTSTSSCFGPPISDKGTDVTISMQHFQQCLPFFVLL